MSLNYQVAPIIVIPVQIITSSQRGALARLKSMLGELLEPQHGSFHRGHCLKWQESFRWNKSTTKDGKEEKEAERRKF